jgi:hypothetical protein
MATDRDGASADEEHFDEPALDALAGEVLLFGDEGDLALHHQRHKDRIREGQVVARQNRGTLVGQVLPALHLWPEDQPQPGPEEHVLQQPVQHLHLDIAGLNGSDIQT